jgi:bifunctional non-homologous end joining protein LigD
MAQPHLAEYNRKRDFKRTPEPPGRAPRGQAGLSFCIQKHAAKRLHYDFRLELDGVLKSWAVPKGPSYDTADKRLAVRTEDHPVEYADFEGIIPAGEYGGGTVLLWDRGCWEPLEDPHAGLAKGVLKFRLQGEKLEGAWALVKIKSRDTADRDKTWLLIKERDATVRPGSKYDVTQARPESVLSGRELDAIAADRDRVWSVDEGDHRPAGEKGVPVRATQVLRGRKAALPRFVKPQLATLVHEAPEGADWLHEMKFDGYRLQARRDAGAVTLWSRNAKEWTKRFAAIAAAVGRLPCRQALIDGEAAVLLPNGTTSFSALQNAQEREERGAIVYFAFDLLHLDGQDLTKLPLAERKAVLARLLEGAADPIRYSDHVEGSGPAFLQKACGMKLEGIVSKRREDAYQSGRSRSWLKAKCSREQELVIVGFTEPEGGREGLGALLLAVNDGGELRYVGKVGTGFTAQSAEELRQKLDPLVVEEPPIAKRPPGLKNAHWVTPRLVAQVQFTEWTPGGALRHPSFKGLRADKAAAEVVREERQVPQPGRAATGKNVDAVGRVRMTHPERILYPASGLTKRGLAEFYVGIAEWILPHVAGRPTSLVRCPEGIAKKCFYQKHGTDSAPTELRRVSIREKHKTGDYLVVEDEAGLLALAQMSILEIHTWNSHADTLEAPDRVVFDLDPAEDLPWKRVVEGALLVRKTLEDLALESFVKTTGGKGLHVVVPLQRGPSWDEALTFTETVARWIAGAHPTEYVANMSKAKRVGRIYIDYLRNERGATSVCAYSTRARENAPVSVPLHWDELDGTRPDFTVANVPARLRKLRQDPWKGYEAVKQRLPGG